MVDFCTTIIGEINMINNVDAMSYNYPITGVCGQGLSYVFAAPPIKYFVIFLRLSIANPNPNPNLKP